MSNEYFNPASVPAPNAPGSSAVMRAEIARIAAAFDLMPVMAGSANEFVVVDPTGTRLIASGTLLADLVTVSGAQTVTEKTFAWSDNNWVGFGTAATKNAGTGAGEVLLLAENAKLPVLDASNLTNINPAAITNAVVAFGINLKADANNAILTGAPVAPTPSSGDNSARISTTAFVQDAVAAAGGATPSNSNPLMNGVVSPGAGTQVSRHDHVHPTDTSRAPASAATAAGTSFSPAAGVVATNVQAAIEEVVSDVDVKLAVMAPINSPTFTGAPKAPTPVISSNDTSVATTAFTQSLIAQQPTGMQPSNSNPLMNGVVAPGTGVEASRYDHVHPTDTSRAPASAATAGGTSFTPVGSLSATNVQAAIVELLGETATAAQGALADGALPRSGGTMVGNIVFAAGQTWPVFNQDTTGSAASLTTARTINGTSFNGTANITTANWGTSRTLTVGSTGKSVNGSGDVSWSLAEIGAASASHTHAAGDITSGTLATARLGSGTANAATFLRGDQTWQPMAASVWEKISEANVGAVAFFDVPMNAAGYIEFKLVLENVRPTANATLRMQPYHGATLLDNSARINIFGYDFAGDQATFASSFTNGIIPLSAVSGTTMATAGTPFNSVVDLLPSALGASGVTFSVRTSSIKSGNSSWAVHTHGVYEWSGQPITMSGARVSFSGANFQASGRYVLYGLRRN